MSVRMVYAQGVLTRIPYVFYAMFIAAEQQVHWLMSVIPPGHSKSMRTVIEDPYGSLRRLRCCGYVARCRGICRVNFVMRQNRVIENSMFS